MPTRSGKFPGTEPIGSLSTFPMLAFAALMRNSVSKRPVVSRKFDELRRYLLAWISKLVLINESVLETFARCRFVSKDGHNECFCCADKIALLHFHSRTSPQMSYSVVETVVALLNSDSNSKSFFKEKREREKRKKEIERKMLMLIETREFHKQNLPLILYYTFSCCCLFCFPLVKSFLKFL